VSRPEERLREPRGAWVGAAGIAVLVAAAAWIVSPFLVATVWATTIVVVTWPALLGLQARLRGSRAAAVTVAIVLLLLLVVVPLTLAIAAIAIHADGLVARLGTVASLRLGPAPPWLAELPLVGARLALGWNDVAGAGADDVWRRLSPHAGALTAWLVGRIGNFGFQVVQFLLTLVLSAFLYAHGEALAAAVHQTARRLWGEPGETLVDLTKRSIRGVALGVGLAAAIQSALAGLGLAVAGVPFAGLLTALLFLLCLAQVGMLVLLVPIVVWVFWSGDVQAGTLLLAWSVAVSVLDQFLRPVLVGRHADLPPLLIFIGVVGGLVAFGLLGVVVGPVVLAVAYTLGTRWLHGTPQSPTSVLGEGDPRP